MSFQHKDKKSKTVEVILWIVAALLIVAMLGFFISLTNLFEADISNREDISDNQDSGTNMDTDNGNSNGNTNNETPTPKESWQLVLNANELRAGDKIIIVATGYDVALGTAQLTSNRSQAPITKDGNTVTISDETQVITLVDGFIEGTYAFTVGTGYLYAPSSSSNALKTKSNLDENGCWLVEIDEAGIANIVAQGESERNTIMYNATSTIFSCYANTNTQKTVSIYKLIASASD